MLVNVFQSIRDGKSLKAARTKARMSQTELAAATGIQRPTLSAIENGREPLSNSWICLCQTAIAEFVNARFKEMPAARAQEQRIRALEAENRKLKTEGYASLREPLILSLEKQIQKLATELSYYKQIVDSIPEEIKAIMAETPKKGKI